MKEKRYIIGVFAVLIAALVSFRFDEEIVVFFESIRVEVLDNLFYLLSSVGTWFAVLALITVLLIWTKEKRKKIIPVWVTVIIGWIIGFILKIVIGRPRPFEQGIVDAPDIILEGIYSWSHSLPSGHALIAFSVIPFLMKEKGLRIFWIGLASLIAISRVYFGVHFMSDIILGGFLGYIIGMVIYNFESERKSFEKFYFNLTEKLRGFFVK